MLEKTALRFLGLAGEISAIDLVGGGGGGEPPPPPSRPAGLAAFTTDSTRPESGGLPPF